MSPADLIPLLPLLIIAGTSLVVLVLLSIRRNHGAVLIATVAGLAAATITASSLTLSGPRHVTPLLLIDNYALFSTVLICLAGIAIALIAYDYWRPVATSPEEFYLLLLFATLGSAVLVSSSHFMSFFLGLETLSISLYGMIAYRRDEPIGIEAGIKYLILAAVSSAFLLFGMAMIYAETGSLSFPTASSLPAAALDAPLVPLGLGMILVGFGFKLALVPFHLWTPDVYQGAPAPATAFVATVSKGAVLVLLLRFAETSGILSWRPMAWALAVVAIVSMFAGNLLALRQQNLKRILAYSSIAHMGYLLVALISGGATAMEAVAFYLVAYFASMIGAFAIVAMTAGDQFETGRLSQFRGLAWRHPWLGTALSAMLFSLAGIPLTAGFLGKLYVLSAGVGQSRWALVLIFVINSALGIYYYLRVVITLFQGPEQSSSRPPTRHVLPQLASGVALAGLVLSLIWFGVYPAPLIRVVQSVVASLM